MSSRKKLQNIFCISLSLLTLFSVSAFSQIAFSKFENNSSYEGNWELAYDVPNFISSYVRESFELISLSPKNLEYEITHSKSDSLTILEFINQLGFKYFVTGKISKFSISRFTAGEPKLAGYETYSNDISLTLNILDLSSNKIIFSEIFSNEISDLGVGVTIFGRESASKREFYNLDNIRFGSSEFVQTLVGKNMIVICESFTEKAKSVFSDLKQTKVQIPKNNTEDSPSPFVRKIIKGEILLIDHENKEVFINLGSSDNLSVGTVLSVYAIGDSLFDPQTNIFLGIADRKVGEIEIVEIRGERFSLGIIRSETEEVKKGNQVRKISVLPR
ncbi:MAG: hypothetical protein KJ666_17815 [Bacteroidetes bacterium]|nr:hypothetical protein [Bacteroidota bacterium]MBU2584721.1 hypothetical protein [Bacteroidota bacterium]